MIWPKRYSDTFFNFRPGEIEEIRCQMVANRRLNAIGKSCRGCLQEVLHYKGSIYSDLTFGKNFWHFGKVIVYERWSVKEVLLYCDIPLKLI